MRVKGCHNHRVSNQRRIGDIEVCFAATVRAPDDKVARKHLHIDPTTFFMALTGIVSHRIYPSMFQCLSHRQTLHQFRNGRR